MRTKFWSENPKGVDGRITLKLILHMQVLWIQLIQDRIQWQTYFYHTD